MYRYQTGKNDEMVYSFYKLFYNSLARLNNVLAAAENLEGADVDILKGELYAMRALYHFDLARVFAKLPSTTDMNDLGIVLSTEVYPHGLYRDPGDLTADIRPDIERYRDRIASFE